MNGIRVIICRIGKYPYVTYIPNTPEDIRRHIGGDYESARHGLEIAVLHRRQQDNLPPNKSIMIEDLCGDCIIAGVDGDGYRGLTRRETFYLLIDVRDRFKREVIDHAYSENDSYI